MAFAFVFPGQGSQSVGMLSRVAEEPAVRHAFERASAVLGYDLWQLTQQGPEDALATTEYTQPAMLTAGIALASLWRERGGAEPALVTGHSLGEFTALVCAGALEFDPAVALVRERGRLMQQAVPAGAGAMAAVLGLEEPQIAQACAAAGGVVEPVNFNAPGQIVIAGERAAVTQAIEAARALGARRAVLLSVSVPSHCSLMREAATRFGETLASVPITAPRLKYVSAVDAGVHTDPQDIRALLVRQLASPVRWQETVRALIAQGARVLIECGPGKVLTGLNRRIERDPGLQCLAIEDIPSIQAALGSL